jgi:alpha-tubulin suppressor-like RCC1 family protein
MIIDLDDRVWVAGCNYKGQLGFYDGEKNYTLMPLIINKKHVGAKSIACGYSHTIMVI